MGEDDLMKTAPKACRCGAVPEVTRPGSERNCWMVMCSRCRRNGPSVIDPQGREYAVTGWNLGLDDHFLLGAVGEDWHHFSGRPRYEYTRPESGDEPLQLDVNAVPDPGRDIAPISLRDEMSTNELVDYALAKGDPDLIWMARKVASE
jgi:hypothetical protein